MVQLKKDFEKEMKFSLEIFKEEINKKEYDVKIKRYCYVHRKLRLVIKSLINNLNYLFTYKKYPELNIPNTINLFNDNEFSYRKRLRSKSLELIF